ncbi:QacE family quaternary ammonium compound efflux SMR transporter [Paenibacillus sambharensis]|uniref:QacE family quaternary ammonium compound efflux SMR transporter n=1 Tax=Paenibacillus sambharensis TaxID=1803190 RepID=A0A2W1LHL5_9BACL|nr:multidrug efflux SMR transporter [Paenibacillus sambharensis]PZD94542.1 QacE family quaternary ammonium compound efflux SMR transporter [Paenibacillus sambharensis]
MKWYVTLGIAIAAEIFGSSMLKFSDGFTYILPSIGFVIGFGISFYALSVTLKSIPLSMAYAIWSGAGTALTALIGVLIWGEAFNLSSLLGIVLIIGGVVLLNLSESQGKAREDKEVATSSSG